MDALGDRMPVRDGDLATIAQPLDWWGLNYYFPTTYQDDPDAEFPSVREVPSTDTGMRTDIGWEIKAKAMTDLLVQVHERYDLPPVYITENGACYNMGPDTDGVVEDEPRRAYLDDHLAAAADALDAGVPLRGYFAWSLMDNFEWAEGYAMRFGIVHVDYDTQVRTVKRSGEWYSDIVRQHRGSNA